MQRNGAMRLMAHGRVLAGVVCQQCGVSNLTGIGTQRVELISSALLGGRATHCLYNIICTSCGEIKAKAARWRCL